jgi:hypothetical protein
MQNPIADAIAAAYLDLADAPQLPIHLSAIRPLVNAPREAVDATILEMTKTGLVHLFPDSSRKRNQPEEIAAAIRVGGENKNFLCIEAEYFGE